MLLYYSVSNFKSIKEPLVLSCLRHGVKPEDLTYSEAVSATGAKLIEISGAPDTGKTNVFNSLEFLKKRLTWHHLYVQTFAGNEDPTTFKLIIKNQGLVFYYELVLDSYQVYNETLSFMSEGTPTFTKLFTRNTDRDCVTRVDVTDVIDNNFSIIAKSLAKNLGEDKACTPFVCRISGFVFVNIFLSWFERLQFVSLENNVYDLTQLDFRRSELNTLRDKLNEYTKVVNPDLKLDFYQKCYFSRSDLLERGLLVDDVEDIEKFQRRHHFSLVFTRKGCFLVSPTSLNEDGEYAIRLMRSHDGYSVHLSDSSSSVQEQLRLIPVLLGLCNTNNIYLLDGIIDSLSPTAEGEFLKYFLDNRSDESQLFYTTHAPKTFDSSVSLAITRSDANGTKVVDSKSNSQQISGVIVDA